MVIANTLILSKPFFRSLHSPREGGEREIDRVGVRKERERERKREREREREREGELERGRKRER